MHIAAQNGHEEITKWLIGTLSADPNAQNRKGQSPLHMYKIGLNVGALFRFCAA